MRILVPVFAGAAILALGAYINLTLKEARYLYSGPIIISVTGEGEAFAVPDIATFSFSVRAEAADASVAQSTSAERVNAIMDYLESEGVEENDINTEYYDLSPRYEYTAEPCPVGGFCPPGERVLRGYEVNQTISVKVRNTDNAGTLISGVGERGATDVSGLQFTIDDEDTLRAEAREQAIADAKAKAEKLAKDLDVKIVRMNSFWEDQGYYPHGYGVAESRESFMTFDTAVAPSVPIGEESISVSVNISYEVR